MCWKHPNNESEVIMIICVECARELRDNGTELTLVQNARWGVCEECGLEAGTSSVRVGVWAG